MVDVETDLGEIQAWLYIGLPENPHFLGPSTTAEMVAQIEGSAGPSGSNRDYVLKLAEALGPRLSPSDDPELCAIAEALRSGR